MHHVFADEKPFKGKEVYFTNVAMNEEMIKQQKPSVKKHVMEVGVVESAKVLDHQQKKKLAVWFAYALDPFTIKVKPDMKGKPLIISAKSSKSVNVASLVN